MGSVKVLGYNIFSGDLNCIDSLKERMIINTINPHSYCVAKNDFLFKKALLASDILLPDGAGIVLATRILRGSWVAKIAGADIHQFLLEKLHENSGKVFYMGASQATLGLIEKRVAVDYPNVNFKSYSPPYKDTFSNEENLAIQQAVNEFEPDVLFVGMTAPKQEKWVFENKDLLNGKIIVSIGAVFDFYAGTVKRPGKFWITLGLEWLPRLCREPKRLWRRNFVSTPLFLFEILKVKLNILCRKK